MRTCAIERILIFSLICCLPLWAQDDAPADPASDSAQVQTASQDDSAPPQPASYDDVATPGQIHGFIPDTWTAGMITLADLQTQEGQDWLNGLTAAQSAQAQTQYVCQNPGPTTTSSDTGDFISMICPLGLTPSRVACRLLTGTGARALRSSRWTLARMNWSRSVRSVDLLCATEIT